MFDGNKCQISNLMCKCMKQCVKLVEKQTFDFSWIWIFIVMNSVVGKENHCSSVIVSDSLLSGRVLPFDVY